MFAPDAKVDRTKLSSVKPSLLPEERVSHKSHGLKILSHLITGHVEYFFMRMEPWYGSPNVS